MSKDTKQRLGSCRTPNETFCPYYANYAVCNKGCSAQALANGTLNETFTSDLYVLFSVPSATQPVTLVYTGANPPIVMSST